MSNGAQQYLLFGPSSDRILVPPEQVRAGEMERRGVLEQGRGGGREKVCVQRQKGRVLQVSLKKQTNRETTTTKKRQAATQTGNREIWAISQPFVHALDR